MLNQYSELKELADIGAAGLAESLGYARTHFDDHAARTALRRLHQIARHANGEAELLAWAIGAFLGECIVKQCGGRWDNHRGELCVLANHRRVFPLHAAADRLGVAFRFSAGTVPNTNAVRQAVKAYFGNSRYEYTGARSRDFALDAAVN